MEVELIAITRYLKGDGSPEALLEHAGRVCYRSESRGDPAAFLRARIREGHESLIEHASATFEIRGISRACSHQLVRHRIASYSQESQRYVSMDDPQWVLPPSIAQDEVARALWDQFATQVKETYRALRARGIRKEDARFVLPNATATRIVVTMNFRELLHVFRLRISPEAQWEIREVAVRMLEAVYPYAPAVFGDLRDDLRRRYPEFFDHRPQTTDDRPQTTDHRPQTADDGRQTTDDRPQTTDDGRQTTDDRPQTTDDGRRTTDHRPRTADG